jgi:hypothetical protein
MSHAATNWAIQQRGLKPTTKIGNSQAPPR